MRNFKYILFFAVLIGTIGYSCKKTNKMNNYQPSKINSSQTKDLVNNFIPDNNSIPNIYYSFVSYHNKLISRTIETTLDISLDTLLWQTETFFNNEYGFSRDSIFKSRKIVNTLNFTIKSFTSSGVPIIDGQEAREYIL